ncbi:MAG: hypothetical protein ACYTHJ_07065 [Planctomycetota bacterium]|jgi:mono/diheme cytochrome c family protein
MTRTPVQIPLILLAAFAGCGDTFPIEFPDPEQVCVFDADLEAERALSSAQIATPSIDIIRVNGTAVWSSGRSQVLVLRPGDEVTLQGTGLGAGTNVDFSKIMIGNSRVLETDLTMYEQRLDIAAQVNYETSTIHSTWDKDVRSWVDSEIQFRVPVHASRGPLVIQVQKRVGYHTSLVHPGEPHEVRNALTSRITDPTFEHACDVVSILGDQVASVSIPVRVENAEFNDLATRGRQAFWGYDYNIGTAHSVRNLDWAYILSGQAQDPITGMAADPRVLFGAYPAIPGQVPDEAIADIFFDPYPQPSPIPGFLSLQPPLSSGNTRNTGFVGYRYAQANHPLGGLGEWIGFNCASCHGYRISYEQSPGVQATRVFAGLPNPAWSMKWTLLDDFDGIKITEPGPLWAGGAEDVDKTALIYSVPQGAGEHNIVRRLGDGHETDNDYQFSPIAIPNVTHYMPIRRSLSHTESYVGFEGSYIHAQEPDGATGSMSAEWLQALTAYMTTLDASDDDLRNIGLYRWLSDQDLLREQAGEVSEGQFVEATWQAYPGVVAAVDRGQALFARDCASCHSDDLGTHSNEQMVRLDEVGRFFAPTIYQREVQAIRTSFLRNLYWVEHRGLLSDGHVRNLEDLVDPDRCTPGSSLHDSYYTLHEPVVPALGGPDHPEPVPAYNRKADVFRVPRSPSSSPDDTGARRNRFIERHKYFVEVPWDSEFYYWDYQKMRAEYGPDEMGTPGPIGMPVAPHPWCAQTREDVPALVQYLLTL